MNWKCTLITFWKWNDQIKIFSTYSCKCVNVYMDFYAFAKPWCKIKELLFDRVECLITGRKDKIFVVRTYKLVYQRGNHRLINV